jgi:hypothetical protein
VRLAAEVLPVFTERLEAAYPDRARKVKNAIVELRGGKMNEAAFGARMQGLGPRWAMIQRLFETHAKRLGLVPAELGRDAAPTTFRRPSAQRSLFDD